MKKQPGENNDSCACETGIVEGFYGAPWPRTARRNIINSMPAMNFQTYIYAPKDDPYHRELWRDPYPEAEGKHLASTIKLCRKNDIEFCWALSPGLSMRYSSKKEVKTLLDKFESVADLGVGTFAVFLDDIPPELSHAADRKKWPSLAHAHVDLVNELHDRVTATKDRRLWFCPTEYIGTKPTQYLTTVGKGIHPDVGIFWTGPLVVSPRITADDAANIGEILKRKPLLWDNYPVNDYNPEKLNLGPLRARDALLPELIGAYFTNPMNQAVASYIPMLTIADYLADPAGYDPDKSFMAATAAPWGEKLTAPARTALRDFCALWPAVLFFGEPDSKFVQAIKEARAGRTAKLKKMLLRIEQLPEIMKAEKQLAPFLREINPFLKPLVKEAEAALAAIELKKKPGDEALKNEVRKNLKAAEKCAIKPTAGNALRIYASGSLKD